MAYASGQTTINTYVADLTGGDTIFTSKYSATVNGTFQTTLAHGIGLNNVNGTAQDSFLGKIDEVTFYSGVKDEAFFQANLNRISHLPLYENDFNTRISAGPIGGNTISDPYTVDVLQNQDQWVKEGTGHDLSVVAGASNQFVEVAKEAGHTAYHQDFGTSLTAGTVTVSVDMLASDIWQYASTPVNGVLFMLGDPDDTTSNVSFGILCNEQSQGTTANNRFVAWSGIGDGTSTYVYGTSTVDSNTWYRFIADVDLDTSTYSVKAYELGTSQPTFDTMLGNEVFSADGMNFRYALGSGASHISTVRLWGRGVAAAGNTAGFDNIMMLAIPEPSTWLLLSLGGLGLAVRRRRRSTKHTRAITAVGSRP